MKSYEDIAERVFKRGDEILRKRQKRTAFIKRTSFAVSGMCAAVLVCFGVWHNNDIKNSFNDLHNHDNIIIEADIIPQITTDVTSQTKTNIIPKTTMQTSLSVTGTATSLILPTTQTATSAVSQNTVIFTTSSPTYSTKAQTDKKTEYLHETTQIMLSTAFQTNPTQTITDVLTQTTTTSVENNEEGGIYMKKLTSFFTSAVVLASSASPIVGHAEFKVNTGRYWAGERDIFAAMDSGELETDIDGNGVVDAIDGYLLECYTYNKRASIDLGFNIPDDINSRIEAIADYNGDGEVNDDDATSWARHFIVGGNLKAELFNHDYYASEYVSPDSKFYEDSKLMFTVQLHGNMDYLRAGYYVVNDMYQNGTLNLDVNGNGQLDIDDLYDFYVHKDIRYRKNNKYIPDEDWVRCNDAYLAYCGTVVEGFVTPSCDRDIFMQDVALCFVENIELKPEYFTKEYYQETYGENYYLSGFVGSINNIVENSAGILGLKVSDTAWTEFNKDDLNDLFNSYCKDVENGVRPAPDVNMDGVVDYNDYFASNIYFSDLIKENTADDSVLPAEIWANIEQNCDFNGNGTTKDIYDILTVQLYVTKYADPIDDFETAYKEYAESLGETSVASVQGFSYENNVAILAANTLYGDANEDGDVDIADATAIIQHIGNRKKYGLSRQGEINADCYNTGDGVTGMDAITIQKLAANMIDTLPYNE